MSVEKTQYQAKLDFLNTYRWRMREAQILRERIDDLEDQLTGIRAQRITDMPRGGKAMDTGDLVAKKVDLLNLYKQDLEKAEEALKAIYECIRSVDSIRDRTILGMNYVDGMSYSRIAEVLNYSSRQIKRINKDAVENMQIPQRWLTMSQCVTSPM
jgi:RNA polymerase sigma factor (sigma-70 family)